MRIARLFRYPVKSMGGEELQSADVHPNGFVGDRRYALLDVEYGTVVCAKIPRQWGHLLNFSAAYVAEPAPGADLPPVAITFPDGTTHRSDDADIDAQLTGAVGREVRIVTDTAGPASSDSVPNGQITEWERKRLVTRPDGQDVVRWELAEFVSQVAGERTFPDGSALHLVTTSSLRRLEELTPGTEFDVRRFRPNILLDDCDPGFIEQEWLGGTLWFGELGVAVIGLTPRCPMPSLQRLHDGIATDRKIGRAIAQYNTVEVESMDASKWPVLGVNATPLGSGRLDVGGDVEIKGALADVS